MPGARVFMDVDTIQPGVDFVRVIEESVAASDVVLALIGDDWLTMADGQGNRRLDNADDFVRVELAAALERNVPVIPILVERAAMPGPAQLPPELSQLARINALEISDDRWDYDVGRLMSRLSSLGLVPPPPGDVGRPQKAMARKGKPVRLALVIGLAVAILAALLVASGGDDHPETPAAREASVPLLVDLRTNIDDFDYTGTAHVPEFLTTRPIGEVGPPPNVRLQRIGGVLADTNQIGRWTWARQLGAVDATVTLLRVTIQGRDDAPVTLQGLSVVVTNRKPPPRGSNLSYTGLGSAVNPDTVMVDLDEEVPTVTYIDERRNEQRSFTFSVSRTDVQVLNILAGTSTCDCSWIIKLKYTYAGEPGEITLDDAGKPFRTVATANADQCYWSGAIWSCSKPG